jgi:hypothetical protein
VSHSSRAKPFPLLRLSIVSLANAMEDLPLDAFFDIQWPDFSELQSLTSPGSPVTLSPSPSAAFCSSGGRISYEDVAVAQEKHRASTSILADALAMVDAPGLEWARRFLWAPDCAATDMDVLTRAENVASSVVLSAAQVSLAEGGEIVSQDVHYLMVPVLTIGKHSVGLAVVVEKPREFRLFPGAQLDRFHAMLMSSSSILYNSHGRFVLNNETGVCFAPRVSPRIRWCP